MSTQENPERYVTATALKKELPFNHEDFPLLEDTPVEFDDAVMRVLDSASALVEQWGGTRYQPTTATARVTRPGYVDERELPLPKRPVQSVESVDVAGEKLTATNDWVRPGETHIQLVSGATIDAWPTEYENAATVEWTYGYEQVPGQVETAIIRLARNALDQIETDGVSSDADGYSFRPPEQIKAECQAMVHGTGAPSYYGGSSVI